MIYISDIAQEHFAKLLANQKEGMQIRVFVINPGTVNAECTISYCTPDSIESTDMALKFDKFIVYIDEISVQYLKDAEIDLITDELGSKLTIKAPNIRVFDIQNDVPLIERIEHMLQTQINPQLAYHGGSVSLVRITNDGYVIIRFGGGCNGCSMVLSTLKEGIEKQLLRTFPELKGVLDFTKHNRGEHSYY